MPITYEPIATTTLGSTASSVTFSSISGSYTDLYVVQTFPNTEVYGYSRFRFNGDTGSSYSSTYFYEYNGVTSGRATSTTSITAGTSSYMSNSNILSHIQNYSNSTTYKTVLSRAMFGQTNSVPREVFAQVGLWRSTAAITSIDISINTGTFAANSTFSLYGIKAA
jgi:hypothetical protein